MHAYARRCVFYHAYSNTFTDSSSYSVMSKPFSSGFSALSPSPVRCKSGIPSFSDHMDAQDVRGAALSVELVRTYALRPAHTIAISRYRTMVYARM